MKKIKQALTKSLVEVRGQLVFTTSLRVAEHFEKLPKNVIRAIEKLPKDEFSRLNFKPRDYIDERGKSQPMYEITRDGFAILGMGFTGAKAYKFKQDFIAAFNAMEKELSRLRTMRETPEWQQARLEGKVPRLEETDVIKTFVEYAKDHGSQHADWYYKSFTTGIYKALFILEEGDKWYALRDRLPVPDLRTLATAELIAQKYIAEGMRLGMGYKEIYKYAIEKVDAFIDIFGKSTVSKSTGNLIKIK